MNNYMFVEHCLAVDINSSVGKLSKFLKNNYTCEFNVEWGVTGECLSSVKCRRIGTREWNALASSHYAKEFGYVLNFPHGSLDSQYNNGLILNKGVENI